MADDVSAALARWGLALVGWLFVLTRGLSGSEPMLKKRRAVSTLKACRIPAWVTQERSKKYGLANVSRFSCQLRHGGGIDELSGVFLSNGVWKGQVKRNMSECDYFVVGEATTAQREFLQQVMQLGLEFVEGAARDDLILRYASNEALMEMFSEPFPVEGSNLNALFTELKTKVVAHSIAQCDPRFLAFPDCGNSLATFAADILSSFLNQNLIAVDRSAPAATFVEIQLLLWLRELIGFSTFDLQSLPNLASLGGMWTPGGNMSNHISILVALQQHFPQVQQSGLCGLPRRPTIVLARGIEHFSFAGAAKTLGLGSDGLLWAGANGDYTTDVASVEAALDNCPRDAEPFLVVCVAGNCRTTGIDSIEPLREICDRKGLWLHVDACHGGCLLLSERYRSQLHGVELADSVSLDPHKGFFVTYPSSYVLFRNPEILGQFARYRDQVQDPNCMDLGLITPFFGSRGFQSLKLWLLIKHLGLRELGRVIERRQELNVRITNELEATGFFTMLHRNDFYRQAFVFCPKDIRQQIARLATAGHQREGLQLLISNKTRMFCERLYRSGLVAFDLFSLQDMDNVLGLGSESKYSVMAMAIGHSFIDEVTIERIREAVIKFGEDVRKEMVCELENVVLAKSAQVDLVDGPAGW